MKKILLVEDNKYILDLNTRYLTSSGYQILSAENVRDALACVEKTVPDLAVLDIMLPDGDGIELCEKMRESHDFPILFLTAKAADRDIIEGLRRGGDDYLPKPYDLDVFGARVEALLRRAEMNSGSAGSKQIGTLRFDLVRQQAFAGNENLNLSGKEYGILFYLANHTGQTVGRKDLCQAVWGMDTEAEDAILWTTVSRLKKKIAPFEDRFYLDSDHSGYELVIIPRRGG